MMNCPSCGAIMVWLNGSILHDPPTRLYHCRRCNIHVTRLPDGSVETDQPKQQASQ